MIGLRPPGWTRRLVAFVGIVGLGSPAMADASPGSVAAPQASAVPAPSSNQSIATLESGQGRVLVIRLGQSQQPSPALPLQLNDIVVTREGRATVRFHSDGTVLRIGPESRVQINETAKEREIKVFFGRLWAHVVRWKERPTRFSTNSTIAAVRGTELSLGVAVDGDETQLALLEGKVQAETDAGSLTMQGGQVAVAKKGKAPALTVQVRPLDAVRWALYYLPVLSFEPGQMGEGPSRAKIRESVEAYRKGDLARAVESLEGIDAKDVKDARFFTYRASVLLGTGKIEEAGKDIDQALRLAPNDADALALQTVVAVVGNQADKALETAKRAVAAAPKSSTAQIARSYALQAKFDLDAARESLETAVKLEPDDALAWARLAEIRSSLGQRSDALEAARKAVALAPSLSRTQTVLGYSYLTQVRTREAREAFQKAIELDGADPLPRLGLGLARIREGDLAEGTRELEVAVSLDPGQSLVRSYLGKAYYEGKRTGLDEREYDLAQQADTKDPTPRLYDAITEQTTNRPVEALRDIQEGIELNDNRAVYRSRLLLDQDLAARSASLGRIYSDLGFQDRALVEGWNSVNTDPSNYSAHRFLADSYAALPRHEIARVSELLQSQLLQPLNMTPIQPRLAESNLFLISAGGPASLSFNEFNPLFSRNGVSLQATGLAGQDGLWSGEGVVAGIYDKLSFSLGYDRFEMDGWRTNAGQKDNIGNVFLQGEISPKSSIQAEYRYRDREHGDLQQRFFQDQFLSGLTDQKESHVFRLGGRHALSSGSTVLASLTYQDSETHVRTDEFAGPDTFIASALPEKVYGAEVQHLFRSRRFDVTSGVGYFKIDGALRTELGLFGFVEEFPTIETKFDHVNLYAYANVKALTDLALIVGGSYDHLSGDIVGDDGGQFNPKLGMMWNPRPTTTVRASVVRTLKRTLGGTDHTLEPTQVAGFNQFFDDFNQVEAWRYGGAIDQKLGRDAYGGAEFSRRDLTVPFIDLESVTRQAPWNEWLGRAYFLGTPHRFLALRAQYIFERFEHDDTQTLGFREVKTHRVPLGVSFFHPSGLGASLTATYWKQEGQFEQLLVPEFLSGRSSFWLVDAAFTYRLPKRYGFVSIGATNLFDENFEYYEVDFDNPTIQPKRALFAKVTLAVP